MESNGLEKEILVVSLMILIISPAVLTPSMGVWLGRWLRTGSVRSANRMARWWATTLLDFVGTILGAHTWYTQLASTSILTYTGIGYYYVPLVGAFTAG